MDINDYKGYLPEYARRTLPVASKGFYVCPFCRSGEKRNKTAALKIYDDRFKCYSCDKFGDIFNLVGEVEQLTFAESVRRVEEMFGGQPIKPVKKRERKHNVRDKYKD